MCYVYFISSQAGVQLIKIGISKNPEERLKALSTGNGAKLKLLAKLKCPSEMVARDIEYKLHKVFEYSRRRGEWFTANKPIRELAMRIWYGNCAWDSAVILAQELAINKRKEYNIKKQVFEKGWNTQKKHRVKVIPPIE